MSISVFHEFSFCLSFHSLFECWMLNTAMHQPQCNWPTVFILRPNTTIVILWSFKKSYIYLQYKYCFNRTQKAAANIWMHLMEYIDFLLDFLFAHNECHVISTPLRAFSSLIRRLFMFFFIVEFAVLWFWSESDLLYRLLFPWSARLFSKITNQMNISKRKNSIWTNCVTHIDCVQIREKFKRKWQW